MPRANAFTQFLRSTPEASYALSPIFSPASLRPTYVDGRWRKPALSGLDVARARRLVLASGQEWTLTERTNGRRDKPVKLKGHKAERLAPARAARIEQAMKEMPKRIEEYYKVQRSLRSHDTQYSRIMDDADAADGQGKKAKKAAQAVRTLEANTAAA